MAHLYIGLSRPKLQRVPIISLIIRAVERTPYSHVYMRLYVNSFERYIIYQAADISVHFVGTKQFNQYNEVIYEFAFEITEEQKKAISLFCLDEAGKPYGFWQLIGIGIVKFVNLFGKKIKNPFASKEKTQVCSEAVGYILQNYFNVIFDKPLDLLTPRDIYETLERYCLSGLCTKIVI